MKTTVAATGLLLIATASFLTGVYGQVSPSSSPHHAFDRQYPLARNIVNLIEGSPYVVPDGKILIVKDWSNSVAGGGGMDLEILVDGTPAWEGAYRVYTSDGLPTTSSGGGSLSQSLAVGIRANAGSTVTLSSDSGTMYASGYLERE